MRKLGVVLAAVFILLPAAALAGLVTNGGFETGGFPPWTQSGASTYDGVYYGLGSGANGSDHYAAFGSMSGLGYISQTLTTIAGGTYDLTYWLQARGDNPSEFNVYWNGSQVVGPVANPDTGNVWQLFTVSGLTATGTSTQLKFGLKDYPAFINLDEIDVVASGAVPEPATVVLCGLGLAALALRRRQR